MDTGSSRWTVAHRHARNQQGAYTSRACRRLASNRSKAVIMIRHCFAFVVLALFVSRAAVAQEVAAGWEGDDRRGYVFASPSLSINISAAQALVLRSAGGYLYYDYPVDGGRVEVTSP